MQTLAATRRCNFGAQPDKIVRFFGQFGTLICRHDIGTGVGSFGGLVFIHRVSRCPGERRVGASIQKKADHLDMAAASGAAQRILTVGVNIGAGSQKEADDFDMTTQRGPVDGGVIVGMNISAGGQKDANDLGAPVG